MTRAKKSESKSTSVNIQFRWNWSNELGKKALAALDWYKGNDDNFQSVAQLLAEALIKFREGKSAIPKRAATADILAKLERIESKIDSSREEMYEAISQAFQNIDPSQYINRDSQRTLEDDLGEAIPEEFYNEMFRGVQGKRFDVDEE